nr:MAG TPA: hypothetical protein [Caudoviricetes sp.]
MWLRLPRYHQSPGFSHCLHNSFIEYQYKVGRLRQIGF